RARLRLWGAGSRRPLRPEYRRPGGRALWPWCPPRVGGDLTTRAFSLVASLVSEPGAGEIEGAGVLGGFSQKALPGGAIFGGGGAGEEARSRGGDDLGGGGGRPGGAQGLGVG